MAYDSYTGEEYDEQQAEDQRPQKPQLNATPGMGFGTESEFVNPDGTPKAPKPAGAYDRNKFRDEWQAKGTGVKTSADMTKFIQDHPEFATGVSVEGKDKFRLPDSRGDEIIDGLFNESGDGSYASWTQASGPGGQPMSGGQVAGMPAPGGGGAGGAGGGGVYGTGNQQMDDAMHSALMSMLTRNSSPVTSADVKDRFGPVDAIMQRNTMEGRNAAAERAAFQGSSVGGAGGSLDAEQNKIGENLNQDEMGLMSGLIGDEMKNRRADVMNALQFAQGEERIRLQKQLADMDNDLQRQGMAQSDQHYYAGLNQNQGQFEDSMDNSDAWKEYIYNQQFGQALS